MCSDNIISQPSKFLLMYFFLCFKLFPHIFIIVSIEERYYVCQKEIYLKTSLEKLQVFHFVCRLRQCMKDLFLFFLLFLFFFFYFSCWCLTSFFIIIGRFWFSGFLAWAFAEPLGQFGLWPLDHSVYFSFHKAWRCSALT